VGALVQVLPEWESPQPGIFVITTARDYLPRKTRAFIEFFRERIGEPPYWDRGLSRPEHRLGTTKRKRSRA
jgi:DNA-binding transcriptional LysR family regulator